MDKTERKERMQFIGGQQRMHTGQIQVCPRCGKAAMRADRLQNPESMSFDGVRICIPCANIEESNRATHGVDDFSAWAALTKPCFKVLPDPKEPVVMSALVNGTECWAWTYVWQDLQRMPVASMRPQKGVLCESPREIGNTARMPAFFVPYRAGRKELAPTKAVRVEGVNIHSEKEAAEEAYDKAVYAIYKRFLDTADMVCSDMVDRYRFQYAGLSKSIGEN